MTGPKATGLAVLVWGSLLTAVAGVEEKAKPVAVVGLGGSRG